MPHFRKRHAENHISRLLKHSPIVALFGHRQVGKTYLASLFSGKLANSNRYFSLDVRSTYDRISADPLSFLKNQNTQKGCVVIDEAQLMPELFPALKEHVRLNPRPGQFLLTGSVRFSSRRAIRESLTGRYVAQELLPFDWNELLGLPMSDKLLRCLESPKFSFSLPAPEKASKTLLDNFLMGGSLPGLFSIRNHATRIQKIETQLETLLERDLRLLIQTSLSYKSLKGVLTELSRRQGRVFEWADLRRSSRVSIPTLKKLYASFESMYLLRTHSFLNDQKKTFFYFEDQGEAIYLNGQNALTEESFERFIYQSIRTLCFYRPEKNIHLYRFETRGGATVPLVLKCADKHLGLIPCLEEQPSLGAFKSAKSFLKSYSNSKVLYLHPHESQRPLTEREWILGYRYLI